MPFFCLFLKFYSAYSTFILSHSYIQYIHPSLFSEVLCYAAPFPSELRRTPINIIIKQSDCVSDGQTVHY